MPAKPVTLRIFVGSPGDVSEERVILEEVVEEYNQTWAAYTGVVLQLVKWETHSWPAAGSDAQAVVTSQMGECDIFIGIFWSKIGTKTPRAASGTVEELSRAYAAFDADPRKIRIMLYFSERPIPPGLLEPRQWEAVHNTREQAKSKGLFKTYSNFENFRRETAFAIAKEVQGYGREWGPEAPTEPVGKAANPSGSGYRTAPESPHVSTTKASAKTLAKSEQSQDFDFLSLKETADNQMNSAASALTEFGAFYSTFNERLAVKTKEMQTIGASAPLAAKRKVIDEIAELLSDYAAKGNALVDALAGTATASLRGYQQIASFMQEFPDLAPGGEREQIATALATFEKTVAEGVEGQANLQASIRSVPPITRSFAVARGQTIEMLDRLQAEFIQIRQLAKNVQGLMRGSKK